LSPCHEHSPILHAIQGAVSYINIPTLQCAPKSQKYVFSIPTAIPLQAREANDFLQNSVLTYLLFVFGESVLQKQIKKINTFFFLLKPYLFFKKKI
jgi:hypothetical protein